MKNKSTRQITLLALFTAMEIVLSRFLSYQPTQNLRFSAAFVPIMLAAYIVGPVGGMIVGGLSDFLGAVLFPSGPYFPGFTATAVVTGLVFGLCFYKKISLPRVILAVLSTQIVCDLLLKAWFLSILYGNPFKVVLVSRLPQVVIMSIFEIMFAEFLLPEFKILKKIKATPHN